MCFLVYCVILSCLNSAHIWGGLIKSEGSHGHWYSYTSFQFIKVWCSQVISNITFEFKHPAICLSLAWEHKVSGCKVREINRNAKKQRQRQFVVNEFIWKSNKELELRGWVYKNKEKLKLFTMCLFNKVCFHACCNRVIYIYIFLRNFKNTFEKG